MTISGFSFIRNGIRYGYPFLESIQSILPVCDEFVIAVGRSEDATLQKIRSLKSRKIRIVRTEWDESLRTGGRILAEQTNIALKHTSGDWAFYLQADEVVHEHDLERIRDAALRYLPDQTVEGLLFDYRHFYGSYRYIGCSRRWYRREIRIVRNGIGVRSWGDAQGFRIGGRKMRVKHVGAPIYHYGWVKPPEVQQRKQQTFNRLWHSDEWVKEHVGQAESYDYSTGGRLDRFEGTHPAVMKKRVEKENWRFVYDERSVREPFTDRALNWIERLTGYRLAEYRNYRLV